MPAGRYLELDRTSSGVYTIDFNKAYNPYCYYNADVRLPVPAARKPPSAADSRGRTSTLSVLQAVFFDFDGVIADTEPLHLRAYQAVLQARRHRSEQDRVLRALSRLRRCGVVRSAGERSPHLAVETRKSTSGSPPSRRIVEEMLSSDAILFPGAAACVKMFAERVPLAVASGALEPEIEIVLEHAGLRSSFAAIASASDGVRGKPAPDLYLLAMAKLTDDCRTPSIRRRASRSKILTGVSRRPAARVCDAWR